MRRLRRQGEGDRRGHPAPRQEALQATWNSLLNRYYQKYSTTWLALAVCRLAAIHIEARHTG